MPKHHKKKHKRKHRKSRFVVVPGNSPVPRVLAPAVLAIIHDARNHGRHLSVNSGFRGDEAHGLLKRLGKATQSYLYWGFVRHLPGFNPANPPHQGTHECYSDGVAYRGPRGRKMVSLLTCGIDWSDPEAADAAAARLHLPMRRPYHTANEAQHRNFYFKPGRGPRRILGRKYTNKLMHPYRHGRFAKP